MNFCYELYCNKKSLIYIRQIKQTGLQLVAIQTAMWRLRRTMNDHPDLLNEVKDLAWEELHLRYQLRSMQIGLDVNEQVKRFFVPVSKAHR